VRQGDWRVAPAPADLLRRVVEITGPVDRKMIINALNSGADAFMADFEDSSSPTWANMVDGQIHLRDAVSGDIRFEDRASGKRYELGARTATLLVRPRGLHLDERHCRVGGEPIPGSLFDFGLFMFHNARRLTEKGSGPYFYLPKLESHLEARWWNDVFLHAQRELGLPRGTVRATVLIETLPAAFEMDEILNELREHAAGLNCGRWDYIFSFIKVHRWSPDAVLPDRSSVTMEQPFMRAYAQLVVRTCHRRGAHAIGGMAAQIPIRDDADANRAALDKVRADKLREVRDGHDGTWVAHPALVSIARSAFEEHMARDHQLDRLREDVRVTAADLLRVPDGPRTMAGLASNVRIGVRYLEAWLGGTGCVPLYHLMEDAATAEISRAQVWQWRRHGAVLDGRSKVTAELVDRVLDEEMDRIRAEVGAERHAGGRFADARALFRELCLAPDLDEFLTLRAYEMLD
jgi:malate synthase